MARAAAAWAVGLGVIGVAGAAAHDAPRETTVRVEGAVYGEGPGAATEEAPASTTVTTSAPETPDIAPSAPMPPPPLSSPSPPPTTTSEATTAPPTSSQATTTTRRPQATTGFPSTSTSVQAPTTATYFVTNSTASTAVVVINDVTHRVLTGQTTGPFTTSPRSMGEAGGDEVVLSLADDPTCGVADSDRFFHPGVTFDVHIFESPGFCFGLATAHAPSFTITSRLPTTG